MGWFRKNVDPIAAEERQLNDRIAQLEGQIRALHQSIDAERGQPKLRSTALPHSAAKPAPPPAAAAEPTFEEVNHRRFHNPAEPETASHFNELGVRKYDPFSTVRRWWSQLRGASSANPKLLNYLAAGSVHGLRPLRYEKRVARNRFLALCAFFLVILFGLIRIYLKNR